MTTSDASFQTRQPVERKAVGDPRKTHPHPHRSIPITSPCSDSCLSPSQACCMGWRARTGRSLPPQSSSLRSTGLAIRSMALWPASATGSGPCLRVPDRLSVAVHRSLPGRLHDRDVSSLLLELWPMAARSPPGSRPPAVPAARWSFLLFDIGFAIGTVAMAGVLVQAVFLHPQTLYKLETK